MADLGKEASATHPSRSREAGWPLDLLREVRPAHHEARETAKTGVLRLRRVQQVAVAVLAVLSLASYAVLVSLTDTDRASAAVVNLGGRQRMLSQRVGLLVCRLAATSDGRESGQLREELRATVATIARAHDDIVRGSRENHIAPPSAQIRAILFDGAAPLDAQLRAYLADAQALAASDRPLSTQDARIAGLLRHLESELIPSLERLVRQVQDENELRVTRIRQTATALVVLTLLLLLGIERWLFAPIARDVDRGTSMLVSVNDELSEESARDGLTGLANRRSFERWLGFEWRRSRRKKLALTLLFLDVDHFKAYNDTCGHPSGDVCLKRIASELQRTAARPGDMVARMGGEEFAVLLPETDGPGAEIVAERLRRAIEELKIAHPGSPLSPVVTVSVGVVTAIAAHGVATPALLEAADVALYRAKEQGRNRVARAEVGEVNPASDSLRFRRPVGAGDPTVV